MGVMRSWAWALVAGALAGCQAVPLPLAAVPDVRPAAMAVRQPFAELRQVEVIIGIPGERYRTTRRYLSAQTVDGAVLWVLDTTNKGYVVLVNEAVIEDPATIAQVAEGLHRSAQALAPQQPELAALVREFAAQLSRRR